MEQYNHFGYLLQKRGVYQPITNFQTCSNKLKLLISFLLLYFSCTEKIEKTGDISFQFVRAIRTINQHDAFIYKHYIYVKNQTNIYNDYYDFICRYVKENHQFHPIYALTFVQSKKGLVRISHKGLVLVDTDEIRWKTVKRNTLVAFSLDYEQNQNLDSLNCPIVGRIFENKITLTNKPTEHQD